MPLILGANTLSAGGYEVDNSLRFNSGSTEYLQRTPGSAGSLTTWTYSFWTKRSVLATAEQYLSAGPRGGGGNVEDQLYSISTDQINWYDGTAASNVLRTTQLFRDVSAWYHIMYVWDTTNATAGDRARIYVNGAEVTAFSVDNNPSLNAVSKINGTGQHRIGQVGTLPGENLNGYLAEVNFIDGQALDPDNFGEFDSDTGIWKPIVYTGSYGTNGFLLEFKDSSALGDDTSGNGNDFTVNNLTSIDQTTDTPTNNFATMNAVDNSSVTLSEGNLSASCASPSGCRSTIGVTTGKWYVEVKYQNTTSMCGVVAMEQAVTSQAIGAAIFGASGTAPELFLNGSTPADYNSATAFTANDIMQIALDMDSNTVYFGLNGSWFDGTSWNSASPNTGHSLTTGYTYGVRASTGSGTSVNIWNFGNPPFAITTGNADADGFGNFEYDVPSGYFALCSKNLAEYG
jgi:hypothetical protein